VKVHDVSFEGAVVWKRYQRWLAKQPNLKRNEMTVVTRNVRFVPIGDKLEMNEAATKRA